MMHHIKRLAKKKSLIGLVSVFAVSGTVYGIESIRPPEPVRYVLAAAERGALVESVSGSGQISGQNQVDLKPSVSAPVTAVLVQPGTVVKAGDPLFQLDPKTVQKNVRDAGQSVRDAQLSVASAQLSLEKVQQGADATALLQAQNRVNDARRALEKVSAGPDAVDIQIAERDLESQMESARLTSDGVTPQIVRDAYDDAVAAIKSTAQTAQAGLDDADEVLGIDSQNKNDAYESLLSVLDSGALMQANAAYAAARSAVRAFVDDANDLQTYGELPATIDEALRDTQGRLDSLDELLYQVDRVLGATITSPAFSASSLSSLRSGIQSDRSSLASKGSGLSTQAQAISKAKASSLTAAINVEKSRVQLEDLKRGPDPADVAAAQERLRESEASLHDLERGADDLDLKNAQNALAQRRSSLTAAVNRYNDARELLQDYTVRAPFDGVMATVAARVGDQASGSTVLGTLVTEAKIAELTLNEVDVIGIKTGQKATLTFDAIQDLTIAGVVSEVDAVGTVNQGVVGYTIKTALLTDDERIKAGMSVSVSIVTNLKQDTLLIPAAALQQSGNTASVLLLNGETFPSADATPGVASATEPTRQTVQVGLRNDQSVEIVDGIKEGDQVVVRTIDPSTTTAASRTSQATGGAAIRIPGVGGGFGGTGGANATFIRGR